MAKLTGYKVGWITHTVHDLHIYENQREAIAEFVYNDPFPARTNLTIGDKITVNTTLEELDSMPLSDIFSFDGYQSHGRYDVPLTV